MEYLQNYILIMSKNQILSFFEQNKENMFKIEYRDDEPKSYCELMDFLSEYFQEDGDDILYEFQLFDDQVKISLSINIYFEKPIIIENMEYEKLMPAWE